MSVFSIIANKIKEIFKKMVGSRTIENTLHVAPVISVEMENAINLWSNMYKNKAPWLHEPDAESPVRIVSLGLPAMIASEKARMVVLEMNSEITTPTKEVEVENPDYKEPEPDVFGNIIPTTQTPTIMEDQPIGDTSRAEYLNEQYVKLKDNLRKQLEYAIAKGGLVIKPYVSQNKNDNTGNVTATIEFDYIQADCFYPLAFDATGKITEAAFIQSKVDKEYTYRRLEYHKWQNNKVEVVNKVFRAFNNYGNSANVEDAIDLGKEVSLKDVPEWSGLQEKTVINDVEKPLFAYFKMPEGNTIDMTSPLGVSGYSRAVSLIKDADMQYSRLLWEYEAGEMAIDIDRDAMNFMDNGNGGQTLPVHLQGRLFRKIDLGESDTYQPYSPTLRDTSFIQGLNTILMRIEDVCAISRGTLSDASAEARTATELKVLKQRSYSANDEIQRALEATLKDVIYIMNVYASLYEITPEGEYETSFEWDDSILVDVDTELGKQITLLQNGLVSKQEVRMWYKGETEKQAAAALAQIDEENAKAMEQNLMEQSNLSNIAAKAKMQEEEG